MIGLKHEEEIELDLGLGLSIGGCSFRRSSEKLSPIKNEPVPVAVQSQRRIDSKKSDFDEDPKLETTAVDPQAKRENEALRRQEAKRKRQQKKATFTGIKNGEKTGSGDFAVVHGNKMRSNSPDLETKEGESKRRRVVEEDDETEMRNVNLNFTVEQNINFNKSLALGYSSKLCPIMYPYPYPYPAIHYVPFTNGLSWPCWASGGGGRLQEQNMVVVQQSMVDQSDRGCEDLNTKSGSNGSPVCSSSVVSDYRCSSLPGGGGSSDSKSRSSHSLPEQNPLHGSGANNTKDYYEHSSSSSHSRETAHFHYHTKCAKSSVDRKMIPAKPEEEAAKEAEPVSSESQVSTTTVNPPLKEPSKREMMMGKPPKPRSHNQNPPSRQMMPCVSTTGNGPNGKTINGFLYRYTKSEEVSIICVCHGTSFSPAEFVKHAGGKDVSNPLKHITVIPSTF